MRTNVYLANLCCAIDIIQYVNTLESLEVRQIYRMVNVFIRTWNASTVLTLARQSGDDDDEDGNDGIKGEKDEDG